MSAAVETAPAAAGTAARLRATSALAGSALVVLAAGAVRGRAMATILGPEGFGLAGLLQSALASAAALGAFGLSVTGVRMVARARSGSFTLAAARRTILAFALVGGILAAAALLAAGVWRGAAIVGRPVGIATLAVIAAGVLAQTLAQAQSSWLAGNQRVSSIASSSIWGAAIGAALAVAVLAAAGARGIALAVVAPVIAELFALTWFARRVIATARPDATGGEATPALRDLLGLGAAVAAAGAVATFGQLAARGILRAEWGLAGVGNLHAAWTISMSYLGIVFSAMAIDYYPRLSLAADAPSARAEINSQTRFALRLAAPLLLATLAAAPLVVRLLFADGFDDAPAILRFQLLGDVFKIPGWALAFLLLARGAGLRYLAAEACWTAVYLTVLAEGAAAWGPVAAGIAFCAAYVVYLVVTHRLAAGLVAFTWEAGTVRLFALLLAAVLLSLAASRAGRAGIVLQAVLALLAVAGAWRAGIVPSALRSAATPSRAASVP